MARKAVVPSLLGVNILISGFLAYAYHEFTLNLGSTTEMAYRSTSGWFKYESVEAEMYRLIFCAVILAFFQGLLAILNLSVMDYVEPDRKRINKTCVVIAAISWIFALVLLAGFDWSAHPLVQAAVN